jgi:GNAT superfamily N-acetyltransferase
MANHATPRPASKSNSGIEILPVGPDRLDDLGRLFGTDDIADRCWCMWFIVPYKDFHPGGRTGNRLAFIRQTDEDPHPMGLIAYHRREPAGWCAVGPRARYTRATKGPTLHTRTGDDVTTWFVPCFFVHHEHRHQGIAAALLAAAVRHAAVAGALTIEGFPRAGDTRRSGGSDYMTGNESLFKNAGFEPTARPSTARVIMRRTLT